MPREAFQQRDWIEGFQWPERRGTQGCKLVGGAEDVSRLSSEVRSKKRREQGAREEFPAPENIWEDFGAGAGGKQVARCYKPC